MHAIGWKRGEGIPRHRRRRDNSSSPDISLPEHHGPEGRLNTRPEYTREAREAKLEGAVILSAVIGADGVPASIAVVRGLGMGLDEKAVECLGKWCFQPATRDGKPVPMEVRFEIDFRLP